MEKIGFWKHLWQNAKKNIITGIIVLIPFGTTIIVVKFVFDLLNTLSPVIRQHIGVPIPGIGAIVMLLLLALAGMITRNVLGKTLLAYFEKLITKAPIVGAIYRATKQVMSTFSSSTLANYKKVVLVRYPHPELLAIGFVTGMFDGADGRKYYNVFIPTTPNPTSGMMEIVLQDKVVLTRWTVEEAVKLIVSGGILVPDKKFDDISAPSA